MNELPTDPGQELSTFTDLFVSVPWKPIEPKETAKKKEKPSCNDRTKQLLYNLYPR
jgi:hypothetical protein